MGNNQSSFYQGYMKNFKNEQKGSKRSTRKIFSEYFDVAEKKIRNIYEDVITDFYNSYPDPFYDRRGSLYNLIQTKSLMIIYLFGLILH